MIAWIAGLALAAPDLRTTLVAPSVDVYVTGTWTLSVKNAGSSANSVSVVVDLPKTNNSPVRYVMGSVGTLGTGCTLSGTTITCTTSQIKAGKTKVWTFDLLLAQSTAPLTVTATASSSTTDSNPADNVASVVPVLGHPSIAAITQDLDVYNEHCTGTNLTSFWECVPGSVMGHDSTFLAGGGLTFPGLPPDYAGSWSQPTLQTLHFEYTEYGLTTMVFDGWAVDAACWEGVITTGGYTIPYSVCPN